MKNITILFILCISVFSLSLAQSKNKEKNLSKGEVWHKSYVETGREMRAETKKVDCESEDTQAYIDMFISIYDTIQDFDQKRMTLQRLGKTSCSRVMAFYILCGCREWEKCI